MENVLDSHDEWQSLCKFYGIEMNKSAEIWNVISTSYNESHRYYHTMKHIEELLSMCKFYQNSLNDRYTVILAIFFHDIVYNLLSQSNEEDSALLFRHHLTGLIPEETIQSVDIYILATKSHKTNSDDSDMKYFLDFDMAILSSDISIYLEYAKNIRKEYMHIDKNIYCQSRSKFLRSLLHSTQNIYLSLPFSSRECIARANIETECRQLENNCIPGFD